MARRPQSLDSPGLWAATAPPGPSLPVLEAASDVDIAIVGAGYTGLSAALHAAQMGARVAVLEAQHIGAGGSGRNVGLVNAGMWIMPDEAEARLSAGNSLPGLLANAPASVWTLIETQGIACEAWPVGTLHCAPNAAGSAALAERHTQWQQRQVHLDLLDAHDTHARTGSTAFQSALFDPRAGTVQPLAYARGLAHAALRAGAMIYENTPALSAKRVSDHWEVRTPKAILKAERIIWAGNAYGQGAAKVPGLAILPYFNFATAPLPADLQARILPGGEGAWDTETVLTSFRKDAAGRFIIGSVGALGSFDVGLHEAWAKRKMARLFPELKGQSFEHRWFGRIGTTPDAVPRVLHMGDGAFGIAGYNGRGIAPGTVLGRLLAEHALGQARLLELTEAAPSQLAGVKGAGYRLGAAALHFVQGRV